MSDTPIVTSAMLRAAVESRARDDEGEFESLGDLIGFSAENKTRTVVKTALEAAMNARAIEKALTPPMSDADDGLKEALVNTAAGLVAAVSLLKRGGKKAAASDTMFDQMIVDYERRIDRARAALAALASTEGPTI